MIRLVRGPPRRLAERMDALAATPAAWVVPTSGPFVAPWAGARRILAGLRPRVDDAVWQRALLPRRALLSLVLRGLQPELSLAEQAERDWHRAEQLGFLSHNLALARPLVQAWAGLFRELTADLEGALVIADVGGLEPGTVSVMRAWIGLGGGRSGLDLVLGCATPATPGDRIAAITRCHALAHLTLIQGLDDVDIEYLPAPAEGLPDRDHADPRHGSDPVRVEAVRDPLDDGLEDAAWAALVARCLVEGRAVDPPICALALLAMREAFAARGPAAVLRLGLALLARGEAELTPADAREAHTLVALAEHNFHLESRGDAQHAILLEHHFRAALAGEPDAGRRSHLLARLCINAARRRDELPAALTLGDSAVAEAQGAATPAAAFLEAWARNGRAYVLARLGRYEAAARDCELGLQRLAESSPGPGPLGAELRFSPLVLLENLAQIQLLAGDLDASARWQQKLEAREHALGEANFALERWLILHRAHADLDRALACAETALEQARRTVNPYAEDLYLSEIGDLAYRQGDAARAFAAFARSRVIRARVGTPVDRARATASAGAAALRAGLYLDAESCIAELVAALPASAHGALAEMLAARLLIAAREGESERADALAEACLGEALADGRGPSLARAACAVGKAAHLLGHTALAREAFARALPLASPGSAEQLAATAGLARSGAVDGALLEGALRALPMALNDAEAWWDLADLARALGAHLASVRLPAELLPHLDLLVRACAQRTDIPKPPAR